MVRRLVFMSLLIVCLLGWIESAAQPNSQVGGGLTYLRSLENGDTELHILTAGGHDVLTFAASECYRISAGLTYYAVSQTENPTHIAIYERATRTLIWEVAWDDDWELPCSLRWDSDHILRVFVYQGQGSDFIYYDLTVQSRQITGALELEDVSPILPSLADDANRSLYVRSPAANIYVYAYCDTGDSILTSDLGYVCTGQLQTHVYDVGRHETLQIFEDMSQPQSRRLDTYLRFVGALRWSTTGRYIAYLTSDIRFPIGIYDVIQQHYVNITALEILPYVQSLRSQPGVLGWSPNERYLAFWIADSDGGENRGILLAIYDLEADDLIISDRLYDWQDELDWWGWLPDSDAILVLQDGTLLRVALDGTETVFDTDVEYVYAHYVPLDE